MRLGNGFSPSIDLRAHSEAVLLLEVSTAGNVKRFSRSSQPIFVTMQMERAQNGARVVASAVLLLLVVIACVGTGAGPGHLQDTRIELASAWWNGLPMATTEAMEAKLLAGFKHTLE